MNKKILLICLVGVTLLFANGFEIDYGAGWVGSNGGDFSVTNNTSSQWSFDGVRYVSANGPSSSQSVMSYPADMVLEKLSSTDLVNGYEVRIAEANAPWAMSKSGGSVSMPANWVNGLASPSVVWTPSYEQYLLKVGSWSSIKVIDSSVIEVTILDSISNEPWFYDSTLYIPDSMGIRGGDFGGGFVDTWWDYSGDSAVWQVQMFPPNRRTKHDQLWNGQWNWDPNWMGTETGSGRYGGTGPFYAMSLAMSQQFMKVDWQLMAAQGPKESRAGVPGYITGNPDLEHGTMHWITTSYNEYVHNSFPKFFPYTAVGAEDGGDFFINTPGYGDNTVGNCPQLANVTFLGALYMMFDYKKMTSATSYDALKFFNDAADQEIAGKLFAWSWNKGPNAAWVNTFTTPGAVTWPDLRDYTAITYIDGVYHTVDEMDRMNRLAAVNGLTSTKYPASNFTTTYVMPGGTVTMGELAVTDYVEPNNPVYVYDENIEKWQIEEFLLGTDGTVTTLGSGGLLWHFDLTDTERQALMDDVDTAFEVLKGKAFAAGIATAASDKITFRYDWLAMLRVIQPHLDLDIPIPNTVEFKNWISTHSNDTVTTIKEIGVESNYPFLYNRGRAVNASNEVVHTFDLKEDRYLNYDVPTVEISTDPDWRSNSWIAGVRTTPASDTLNATYEVRLSELQVKTMAFTQTGDSGGVAQAWVRGYDRNYNAVIDTFSVYWEMPKNPILDSAAAYDGNGDGQADSIVVFLTPRAGGDAISSVTSLQYSWPTAGSLQSPSHTVSGNTLVLKHVGTMTGGAGTGTVRFNYPSLSNYSGDVDDKVGAAMTGNATLSVADAGRANDTVTFALTEPLGSGLLGNHIYLEFHTDSGGPGIGVSSISFNGTTALFAKDAIATSSYKWVKLVSTAGAADTAGNLPATNSKWIPLQISGGKEPTFDTSAVFDRNGDGIADSLYIEINVGTNDPYTIDSLLATSTFNWDAAGNVTFGVGLSVTKTDSTISIVNDSLIVANQLKSGKGTGALVLAFPAGYNLNGTIVDKVGPAAKDTAIVDAQDDARTNDTLYLKVTEALKNSFDPNYGYLEFSSDSGVTSNDIVPSSMVTYHNEDSIVVIMPKDFATSNSYSWVRISGGHGIQDVVDNFAALNSQWVPLTVLGGVLPLITTADFFDASSPRNGLGDSVAVHLRLSTVPGFFTADSIKSASVTWNGATVAGAITVVDDSTITLAVTDSSLVGSGGSGSIELTMINDQKVSTFIADKIAPVITSAEYMHIAGGTDTLKVTFSEMMSFPGAVYPMQVTSGMLILQEVSTTDSSVVYTVSAGTAARGDSIWIDGGAFLGDTLSNQQITDNVKRLLTYSEVIALTLSGASYHETGTPDGFVDEIVLTVDLSNVAASDYSKVSDMLVANLVLPSERAFQAMVTTDITVTATDITVTVRQSSSVNANTASMPYDTITISVAPVSGDSIAYSFTGTVLVDDSIAPVIGSATYAPGEVNGAGDLIDTLIVTFTEDLTAMPGLPTSFEFENIAGTIYSLPFDSLIVESGTTVRFFTTITATSQSPAVGDSIRLVAGATSVSDGINDQNETTVWVGMKVNPYKYSFETKIYPNPYRLDAPMDNSTYYASVGYTAQNSTTTAIVVKPTGSRRIAGTLSGRCIIFDALGNRVLEPVMTFTQHDGKDQLVGEFDARNIKGGRQMGSGTYHAIIVIDGQTKVLKANIGVEVGRFH